MYSPDPPPEPLPNPPPPPPFRAVDLANVGSKGQHMVVVMKRDHDIPNLGTIKQGTRGIGRWPAGSGTSTRNIELHLPHGTILSAMRGNDVVIVPASAVEFVGYVDL